MVIERLCLLVTACMLFGVAQVQHSDDWSISYRTLGIAELKAQAQTWGAVITDYSKEGHYAFLVRIPRQEVSVGQATFILYRGSSREQLSLKFRFECIAPDMVSIVVDKRRSYLTFIRKTGNQPSEELLRVRMW